MATVQNLISSGGMHDHPQTSRPRPQQRSGRLTRLRLAVKRTPRPAPPPAPPTTQSSATAPPTLSPSTTPINLADRSCSATRRRCSFCAGQARNAVAGAPHPNDDYIHDEDYDPPLNPDTQQQSTAK
ncbi:hypothetical protein DFH29DRAFT_1077535 [Suillus ampliporus]|nr:hypothetical protein DFH29DRAFT_1077535 [Suillus ampliporus]